MTELRDVVSQERLGFVQFHLQGLVFFRDSVLHENLPGFLDVVVTISVAYSEIKSVKSVFDFLL